MSNPYDLVVFDWEGTIADTLGSVFHTIAVEADLLGFGSFNFHEARQHVDLGLERALQKAYPQLTLHEHQKLLQAVQQALHARINDICLLPGVLDFIRQLHEAKINMAIATSKGQQSLQRALQVTGLNKFIQITRSAGQVPAKPNPQMLEEIIDEFAGNRATTLMIGDSVVDMEMAKYAQVTGIGMDFYHEHETNLKAAGALTVFDNYKSLTDFLKLQDKP